MARAERRPSSGNGIANNEARRAPRVTIMSSNEDLFLNLAKDEPSNSPALQLPGHPGRKLDLSRPSTNATTNAHAPSTQRSTSKQLDARAALSPATAANSRSQQYLRRPSSSSSALPEYLRDTSSDRASISSDDHKAQATMNNASSRSFSPLSANLESRAQRHNSTGEAGSARPQNPSALRQSNLANETPSSNDSAYASQSIKFLDQTPTMRSPTDGAESVGSTTAASTVWDELEDLRLRIRRLEHSGNRARSTAVRADDSTDRPHTAGTMTTSSSISRPLKQLASSPPKPRPMLTASAHPLLESALAKAKEAVDPDIFRSLEASVSDATAVAELATNAEYSQTQDGSNNTLTADAISQKKMRRKSESLIRSLTELCIALCEDAPRQSYRKVSHPGTRDSPFQEAHTSNEQSPLTYLDERRARLDRSRSAPYRPSSRLSESVADSTRPNISAAAIRPTLLNRYDRRRSSVIEEERGDMAPRSLSRAATNVSQDDSDDHDPTIRAPSRAMSEVQQTRRGSSRDLQKFSRDYTARHPLPEIPRRQTYGISNQSDLSLTSMQTAQVASRTYRRPDSRNSSRLDDALGPSPSLAERLAQRRQQQQHVASAGQLGSISNVTSSSPKPRALSQSGRPGSRGRPSRYEVEQALDSDLSNP